MTLLLTMFPYYLLGNLHCFGMCGPLVLLLNKHPYRYLYIFGRILSYSLVGGIAGTFGAIINLYLHQYYLPALLCCGFGLSVFSAGFYQILGRSFPIFPEKIAKLGKLLSLFILKEHPGSTFLFGFFTVILPCGQTLVVFSACAVYGDLWIGLLNGFCFACLTTPSLVAAMYARGIFRLMKFHTHFLMGSATLLIGGVTFCRGLADLGIIPHLVISTYYHLVIY